MNLCPYPHKNFKKSWTLKHLSPEVLTSQTSSGQKLKLLLWKNFLIQTRHKLQTIMELLLPLLFTAVLVIIRNILKPTPIDSPTTFQSLELLHTPPYIVSSVCDQLYFSPNNSLINNIMEQVRTEYFEKEGLSYNFIGFKTEEDMNAAYAAIEIAEKKPSTIDYESTVPVLGGVAFADNFVNESFAKRIDYKLRFPASQRSTFDLISERLGIKAAWFTELIFPLFQLPGPRSRNSLGGGLPGYHEEGFLYVQYAVERTLSKFLLKNIDNKEFIEYNNRLDVKVQRYPYPGFIDDKFLFALQGWLPLIMLLSFIYPVMNITRSIVYEEQVRIKESMKMMGLPNWLHWTAWFIKSYVFLLISCALMTFLIKTKFSSSQKLSILEETDGFVIFFVLVVFSYSIIGFCFFFSSLFTQANSAATAAAIFWFVFYIPYGFLQPRYNLLSVRTKIASCFLLNTPIAFIWQIVCMLEGVGVGLQWNNLFTRPGPDDGFTVGHCMIMLIINGTLYMLAAFYIEAVMPGDYGVPLPWNFVFKKWYWTGSQRGPKNSNPHMYHSNLNSQQLNSNAYFEKNKETSQPGIEIQGLTKVFGDLKAVNNLTLNMYPNKITALLGHNGAGKTTTMSMLTGLYTPTSGTAYLNGYSITTDIKSVRSSLGLCPQHDVLFGELTVEEHLRFFCLLKGLNEAVVQYEIDRMLTALGLTEKRHSKSATLSGGMKRKLSVGIALCAGSKVVLLDEPTSGMDPGARRSTWDLIQNEKKGRTIVLSTHFMEEADLLGDSIVIMVRGEAQCCGSSLFLKKAYGGGYHLTIVKEQNASSSSITEILRRRIPDIEVEQEVGLEVCYSLPDDKSHLFPSMFNEIEERKLELGISSYGASITTMEEVFMRVGKEAEEKFHAASSTFESTRKSSADLEPECNDIFQLRLSRNKGFLLKIQQFRAMIQKKLIYSMRKRILLMCQMGIPVLYLNLVLIILSTLPGLLDPPPHLMDLKRYETLGKTITPVHCFRNHSILCKYYKSMLLDSDFNIDELSPNQSFIDYMIEKSNDDIILVNSKYMVGFEERKLDDKRLRFLRDRDNDTIEAVGFFNNQPFHTPPLALNLITNAILTPSNHSVFVTNHPFPYNGPDLKQIGSVYSVGFQVGFQLALGMSFLAGSFVVFLIEERESRAKHLQFVSGVEYMIFWIANFVVDFFNYCIACLLLSLTLIIYGVEEFFAVNMQLYVLFILIMYGLAIIPFMYLWSYAFTLPTSGFVRVTLFNIFTGIATMLAVGVVQTPQLDLADVAKLLNKIFLIFPNYALGMGVVQLSSNFHLQRVCSRLNLFHVCDAFPKSICCDKLKDDYLHWEQSGIGKNLVYLGILFVIFTVLLFLYESRVIRTALNFMKEAKARVSHDDDETDMEDETEDPDVVYEAQKIKESDLSLLMKCNTLVARNLTKKYSQFMAVNHLNFAVMPGECFGLLGVNGGGKTTTFKMLSGDLSPTYGDAYVKGFSVRGNLKQVHENIGYCPQFDALINEMTGRETMTMYARLRGIPECRIGLVVDSLSHKLSFARYLNRYVKNYSGGNKRKLSTAIALIGNPPVVFLDEPTTGMDPVARRCLWDVISQVRDSGSSVVLTSHSMEECEALCTRLAIMVNGKYRCLGSPQHLKHRFGEGYTLIAQKAPEGLPMSEPLTRANQELARRRSSSIRIRKMKSAQPWEEALEDLRNFIETNLSGTTLKDIHPGFLHYHISNKNVTWGKMFEVMEQASVKFHLEAYSVGQTTLEQVFLNVSKSQVNEDIQRK